jgi:OPA family glycerol-3-phosphate transporter-like MFS transporter
MTGREHRLVSRQALTVLLLFTGYAAYYFCRSDLSVAMPLLVDHLRQLGLSREGAIVRLGSIASFGVLAYAAGKVFLAGLGDLWGGRRSFTAGLGGAVVFTLLFAAGGSLPVFTIAWVGNRLTQSIGWAGLVKVCSRWFGYSSYGTVMGLLSLSYLIGDAAARQSMGSLIQHGYGWRVVFSFAAGVASCALVANLWLLREARVDAGLSEPEVNPLNLFAGRESETHGYWALFKVLLFNRAFAVVCLLSLGCTIIRETFNTWTPEYLHSFLGYSAGRAASISAIFPAVGAASVLITGWMSDQLGATGRSAIMCLGLAGTSVALLTLGSIPSGHLATAVPLAAVGAVAFCLLGPYAYLAGAFALDFGGRHAGAASSGIIDGVGYLGGVLAGDTVARLSVKSGWTGVFTTLAGVSALSCLAAGYLLLYQRGLARRQRFTATSIANG